MPGEWTEGDFPEDTSPGTPEWEQLGTPEDDTAEPADAGVPHEGDDEE